MHRKTIQCYLLLLTLLACGGREESGTEKLRPIESVLVEVADKIVDIETQMPLGKSELYIMNDFLIAHELRPDKGKAIHLFNKNNFQYITSTGFVGHGPGELVRPGRFGVDSKNRILWVPDHGTKRMWRFLIDSVLTSEDYRPSTSLALNDEMFIERFGVLNDSVGIGKAVRMPSNTSFDMTMAKVNFNTNATKKFGYEHPEAVGKQSNSMFRLSTQHGVYINCYFYCDLLTICDLEGRLMYNIYGPDEFDNKGFKKTYYTGVSTMGNFILSSYIGDVGIVINEFKRPTGNLPSKFLVFDMEGNYKRMINTGHKFSFFCVDESNKRVIAYFADRDHPLGYFDLDLD